MSVWSGSCIQAFFPSRCTNFNHEFHVFLGFYMHKIGHSFWVQSAAVKNIVLYFRLYSLLSLYVFILVPAQFSAFRSLCCPKIFSLKIGKVLMHVMTILNRKIRSHPVVPRRSLEPYSSPIQLSNSESLSLRCWISYLKVYVTSPLTHSSLRIIFLKNVLLWKLLPSFNILQLRAWPLLGRYCTSISRVHHVPTFYGIGSDVSSSFIL